MPIVPATQEAEAGGWLEPSSFSPAWATPYLKEEREREKEREREESWSYTTQVWLIILKKL
jgi:hypothetical protein